MAIFGDGTVSYDGRQNVGVTGKRSAHVDPAVVRTLVHECEAIDVDALGTTEDS